MPLMSLAHDQDMVQAWAELVAHDRFVPRPRRWACGAAFFRGHGTGSRVAAVEGVEAAVEAVGDALVELRAPKPGMARAAGYEGEGWATVRHATTEGATAALKALIDRVRVHYA